MLCKGRSRRSRTAGGVLWVEKEKWWRREWITKKDDERRRGNRRGIRWIIKEIKRIRKLTGGMKRRTRNISKGTEQMRRWAGGVERGFHQTTYSVVRQLSWYGCVIDLALCMCNPAMPQMMQNGRDCAGEQLEQCKTNVSNSHRTRGPASPTLV